MTHPTFTAPELDLLRSCVRAGLTTAKHALVQVSLDPLAVNDKAKVQGWVLDLDRLLEKLESADEQDTEAL